MTRGERLVLALATALPVRGEATSEAVDDAAEELRAYLLDLEAAATALAAIELTEEQERTVERALCGLEDR